MRNEMSSVRNQVAAFWLLSEDPRHTPAVSGTGTKECVVRQRIERQQKSHFRRAGLAVVVGALRVVRVLLFVAGQGSAGEFSRSEV